MSQSVFDRYKLPLGLSEGVEIPLDGTPAVFTVVLPATMNEDFNMELMSRLSSEVGEDGTIRVNAARFQRERRDMFFETCILDATGLPEGMAADEFFKTYPLAARAVFERATELATKADEEASAALGKSESLPNGKASGVAVTNSMMNLSKKGSKSKRAALS